MVNFLLKLLDGVALLLSLCCIAEKEWFAACGWLCVSVVLLEWLRLEKDKHS